MRELVVILPDYFSVAIDAHGRAAVPPATAGAPTRLAALEILLARSTQVRLPEGGWRTWLRERWHLTQGSFAAVIAAAWGLPCEPARQYWVMTPVHLFAGLDSVRLHPQGLLRLTAPEQSQLVEDFSRVFHDSPWRLVSRAQRDLLLCGPALHASSADPATLLGADPSAGLPQGADGANLRRLCSEVELWLHEHPVNIERQRRGQLPVTALWPWDAGEAASTQAPVERSARGGSPPVLHGEDSYVEALWQLRGAAAEPEASEAAPALNAARSRVVLQRVCEPPGLVSILAALERRWLAPALTALRSRQLTSIDIVTAERVHSLRWMGLGRLWRRRRAWWELL